MINATAGWRWPCLRWRWLRCQPRHNPPRELLVASDGIPDACRDTGEEFGDARLIELLSRGRFTAAAFCTAAVESVAAFSGGQPADDLTLLAARVLA